MENGSSTDYHPRHELLDANGWPVSQTWEMYRYLRKGFHTPEYVALREGRDPSEVAS